MIRSPSGARPALPVLALLILAFVAAACVPAPAPTAQTGTPVPAGEAVAAATVSAVTAPAAVAPAVNLAELPVGVDAEGNFYRGDPNAAVKLVEFSEFECPYCARHVSETEPQLRETYIATGQVLHTFRHFPLDFHANAMSASMAAYCAGQQDPKLFWEMHDWLFANQAGWTGATDGAAQFRTQAVALGAVEAEFDLCLADPATLARIEQDVQEGMTRGVQGTPAFFIGDWFISGAYPFSEFQDKIEKAKAGQVPPPTPTPLPQGVEFFQPDPGRAGRTYDGSYYLGDATAPIVILAFEDFKSPESAEHVKSVEAKLRADYIDKGVVRYVVQLFPAAAPRAAVAALCAGQQDKFFEFRNTLLTRQAEWTDGDDAAMQGYAKDLKLDEAAFASCLADEAVQTQIEQALAFGKDNIGVPQAPSYLLIKVDETGKSQDVRGFPGALPLEQFEQNIRELQAPPTPTPTPAPAISKAELASLPMGRDAEGNFYRGDPNALVKLVDYSDFQCPYCSRHAAQTEPLLYEAYIKTGDVVHVFRNYPLDFHANAVPAAKAAFCAGEQDAKLFWELHDWLFANQAAWQSAGDAPAQFRGQAVALGADGARYDACVGNAATQAAIDKDMQEATALGVRGTPAFFLSVMEGGKPVGDAKPLSGALPFAQFSDVIDGLLKQ